MLRDLVPEFNRLGRQRIRRWWFFTWLITIVSLVVMWLAIDYIVGHQAGLMQVLTQVVSFLSDHWKGFLILVFVGPTVFCLVGLVIHIRRYNWRHGSF